MSGTIRCVFPGCDWELYVAGDSRDGTRALLRHRMASHPLEPSTVEQATGMIQAEANRQRYAQDDRLGKIALPTVRNVTDDPRKQPDTGDEVDVERRDWELRQDEGGA